MESPSRELIAQVGALWLYGNACGLVRPADFISSNKGKSWSRGRLIVELLTQS